MTLPLFWIAGTPEASDYDTEVLADSPALYWPLNEVGSGIPQDISGNARHATSVVGSPTPVANIVTNDPESSRAHDFEASNTDSWLGANTMNLGDVFTIEAVFKPEGTGDRTVVTQHNGLQLKIDGSGNLILLHTNVAEIVVSTAALSNATTYHVAATKTGATVKLYIDGVDRTGTVTNTTIPNGSTFRAGSQEFGEWGDGVIQKVAVYSTALSQARIQAHYDAGFSVGPAEQLLPLAPSAATATTALVLRAPDHLQLGVAAATTTTALLLHAPQPLPLVVAAAQTTSALIVRAPDHLQLAPSAAQATTALVLSNPTRLALGAATVVTTTALTLTAPLVSADADLPLQGSNAGTTTALALRAPDHLQLQAATATATTALDVNAPPRLALAPATSQSTTALALRAPDHLQLGAATATATTALSVTTPGPVSLSLAPAAATATTALTLTTPGAGMILTDGLVPDDIRVGAVGASAVYVGDTLVWP